MYLNMNVNIMYKYKSGSVHLQQVVLYLGNEVSQNRFRWAWSE